jgi:UDP-N-acetylmuramate dehydrogenase
MNAGAFGSEVSDVLVSARVFDIKNNLFNDLLPNELALSYRHSLLMNDKTLLCTKAKLLAKKGNREEIKAKMEEFKQKRLSSQPYTSASAGSYFKRPEGYYAAKLIDDCGLKGLSSGAAAVSEKHAGFIINLGGATAADVLALADKVKDSVYKKYGVMLEPEVRYIEE